MNKVEFQIAFGAVKHFGRNLYTSNPPAICELVANSWDAYATECHLVTSENQSLLIYDNGIGMNEDEFENRYAISGQEKNTEIRRPQFLEKRPYMGRKGIGKFSAFSLGDKYILYTKSEAEKEWKKITLEYDKLIQGNLATIPIVVENKRDLLELEKKYSVSNISQITSGTFIEIPDMKRKFTKTTRASIPKILSRRFSVNISEKYNFKLFIDLEEVDLKSHFYYNEVEYIYAFGYTEKEIKKKFRKITEKEKFESKEIEFFKQNKIKGWIGTVSKTESLRVDDDLNSNGVIVYINGKLADENILSEIQNSTIANLYLIGEVEADFLQNQGEDPVLSSRQGLNREIDNVKLLQKELNTLRNDLIKNWNKMRVERKDEEQEYLNILKREDKYKTMYENLSKNEQERVKKYLQKLFDGKQEESQQLIKYYASAVFSIVNSEKMSEVKINVDDNEEQILAKFYELFDKTGINNALRTEANLKERLSIIEELRKSIDMLSKEKVFEKHLAKNIWLINPYWDIRQHTEITTQERIENLLTDGKIEGIMDIVVRVADEKYPIIIELKREKPTPYSAPSGSMIIEQIRKYRRGILKILSEINPMDSDYQIDDLKRIPSFYIVGSHSTHKLEKYDLKELHDQNIQLMTYDEIINKAYQLYNFDLEKMEK